MDSQVEQLHSRAESLATLFEQEGGRSHIDGAIALDREALEFCPPGHPMRSISLVSLSSHVYDRYNSFGELMDLEESIVLARDAMALHPPGHPNCSMTLCDLAFYLSIRYKRLGAMVDLDEAIDLVRLAVELCPPGHPDRSRSLMHLASLLSASYQHLGSTEDLNEAIVLARDAVALCPPGHSYRSTHLNNLAGYLSTRYRQLKGMEDLNEAIHLVRDAVVLCPQGHRDRSRSLMHLASLLSASYQRLGRTGDLDEAIVLAREAVELCPSGHPDHSTRLNNLAGYLSARYKRLGAIADLNEAIVLARHALELFPPDHRYHSTSLNNLALHISVRYNHTGAIEDINEAVVHGRNALQLYPPGHPDHSTWLNNLAVDLFTRYIKFRAVDDIDEAIVLARDTLALCRLGHPHRSSTLDNLAYYLHVRFTQSNRLQDKEDLFALYAEVADISLTVSFADLFAARAWTRVAEDFQHPTTLLAYETCLRLLIHRLATLPSSLQHLNELQNPTSESLVVDAFSACLRNHSPIKAVELLEQGRSVFWNYLSFLRTPLHSVVTSGSAGKTLADNFTQLTLLIRDTLNSADADQHGRVYHLNVELQNVVANIRKLPGLSRFLLPPLFSDLRQAASQGPIIIMNASVYGCDALVVLLDRDPVHIPLQITRERIRDLSSAVHTFTVRAQLIEDFAATLGELWDEVVSPIVDLLQRMHPSTSRIWWCPTAEFSLLPLHAACSYEGQQKLSDYYISSYTPTLTSLIRSRRPRSMSSAT